MKVFTFRTIIGVTILSVIGVATLLALTIYNSFVSKQIYDHVKEDVVSVISILKNDYIYTITAEDGHHNHPILHDLEKNAHIKNTILFNNRDSLISMSNNDSISSRPKNLLKIADLSEDLMIEDFTNESDPFLRAYIKLQNNPKCYGCHAPEEEYLGVLVFDVMLSETNANIGLFRYFSIGYASVLLLIILFTAFWVHYRFVKRSIGSFHQSIKRINEGNYDERLSIPESRELSELGKNFNQMLDSFQNAQKELKEFNEKELENKQKLATVGEMASKIAHEIRNPLAGIANATEILASQMPDNENKSIMEEIRRQAQRVNNAITNMLKFSRSGNLTFEEGDINEIIKAIIFFVKNQVHNKVIEFSESLQSDLPQFRFDREHVEIAMLNLALNAIKAIENEGKIGFTTVFVPQDNKIVITVEDDGCGIPSHEVKNIFTPFYTTRTEGTGLGLAIVKEIVEKHHGRIWVESEVNKGTKFFISIPVANN